MSFLEKRISVSLFALLHTLSLREDFYMFPPVKSKPGVRGQWVTIEFRPGSVFCFIRFDIQHPAFIQKLLRHVVLVDRLAVPEPAFELQCIGLTVNSRVDF